MNRSKRQVSTITVRRQTPANARASAAATTMVTTTTNINKRKNRKRRNKKSPHGPPYLDSCPAQVLAYANTLRDPFEFPGVRVGFGCMVPTELFTAYSRYTTTAGADGTWAGVLLPVLQTSTGTPTLFVSGGLVTAFAASGSYQNYAALSGATGGSEGRVVSCGLRVIPQVPATAAPGLAYVGDIPSLAQSTLLAYTPTTLTTSPCLQMGRAAEGASAVSRPQDPVSYQFSSAVIAGWPTATNQVHSCPTIVLTGLPAGSQLLVEFVLNFELIRSANAASQVLTNPGVAASRDGGGLTDYFGSIESMWSSISSMLPTAATVNQGASIAMGINHVYNRIRRPNQSIRNGYYHGGAFIEEV